MVTAGQNIDRLGKGESSLAALCGASPVKASSGKTDRHRLNPGGDRQANLALHLIAVFRLGCCPRTQAYAARRRLQGKSNADIIRCLKRIIAREVYRALKADLTLPNTPRPSTAILCGNPGARVAMPRGGSVQLAAGDRQARFATRPRRVPRIAGHVPAAQGGVGIGGGDEVAQLLESVPVDTRDVTARGVHVGAASGCSGSRGHALTLPRAGA